MTYQAMIFRQELHYSLRRSQSETDIDEIFIIMQGCGIITKIAMNLKLKIRIHIITVRT
jgi:lipid-A-disaccharide synthase-like uncharacterized protein